MSPTPAETEGKKPPPPSQIPSPSGWNPLASTVRNSHLKHLKPKKAQSEEAKEQRDKEKEGRPLSAKRAAKAKIAGMKGELRALQEAVAKAGISKPKGGGS